MVNVFAGNSNSTGGSTGGSTGANTTASTDSGTSSSTDFNSDYVSAERSHNDSLAKFNTLMAEKYGMNLSEPWASSANYGINIGSGSTGSGSTGSGSTGSGSTGSGSTGSGSTGSRSTGSRSTGSGSTWSRSTGSGSTWSRSTGSRSTGSKSTGSRSTGSKSTGSRSTGSRNTGSHSRSRGPSGAKKSGSSGHGSKRTSSSKSTPSGPSVKLKTEQSPGIKSRAESLKKSFKGPPTKCSSAPQGVPQAGSSNTNNLKNYFEGGCKVKGANEDPSSSAQSGSSKPNSSSTNINVSVSETISKFEQGNSTITKTVREKVTVTCENNSYVDDRRSNFNVLQSEFEKMCGGKGRPVDVNISIEVETDIKSNDPLKDGGISKADQTSGDGTGVDRKSSTAYSGRDPADFLHTKDMGGNVFAKSQQFSKGSTKSNASNLDEFEEDANLTGITHPSFPHDSYEFQSEEWSKPQGESIYVMSYEILMEGDFTSDHLSAEISDVIQKMGIAAARLSDQAYVKQIKTVDSLESERLGIEAQYLAEITVSAVSTITDVVPGVSLVKHMFQVITCTSMITGEKLSAAEWDSSCSAVKWDIAAVGFGAGLSAACATKIAASAGLKFSVFMKSVFKKNGPLLKSVRNFNFQLRRTYIAAKMNAKEKAELIERLASKHMGPIWEAIKSLGIKGKDGATQVSKIVHSAGKLGVNPAKIYSKSFKFSEHALEQAAKRGIPKSWAEKTIQKGQKYFDHQNSSVIHVLRDSLKSNQGLGVARNPQTGAVKTIMKMKNFKPEQTLLKGTNKLRYELLP